VDFEPARRVLRFFDGRGYDIGESSALALYSCIQMLNYGVGDKFIVMLADGVQKYLKNLEAQVETSGPIEVTLDEANSSIAHYGEVLWTHAMFVPKDEGVKLVASSLGCDESKVKIATAQDVQKLLSTEEIPEGINSLLPKDKHKTLLVCMAGGTSLKVAQVLAKKGIEASSLTGGIMGLSESKGKDPQDLVQIAAE
jgi:rhodanese-related sulfurtransferase